MEAHTEGAGVLVLRAWTEGQPPSLRVRITTTDNALSAARAVRVVASPTEAADVVRDWLTELIVSRAADPTEAAR